MEPAAYKVPAARTAAMRTPAIHHADAGCRICLLARSRLNAMISMMVFTSHMYRGRA